MNLSSTDKMADNNIEFISYTVACNLSTQSNLMKICGTISLISCRLNVLKGVKKMASDSEEQHFRVTVLDDLA